MKIKQLLTVFILALIFVGSTNGMSNQESPQDMLFKGVEKNNINLVKDALKMGADVNAKDANGNTALLNASINENKYIIELLLAAKANPNIQDKNGYTVLMRATLYGNENLIKLLLDAKTDPNIQNKNGYTALMIVTLCRDKNIVKLLLGANADLNLRNNDGETAIDIARRKGFHEIEKILKDEMEKQRLRVKEEIDQLNILISDLADIVSEYIVCTKEPKKELI